MKQHDKAEQVNAVRITIKTTVEIKITETVTDKKTACECCDHCKRL